MNSRYTESRAAYREVQERHEDIKRIEKTLGELAQLFNDVSLVLLRTHTHFRSEINLDERPG